MSCEWHAVEDISMVVASAFLSGATEDGIAFDDYFVGQLTHDVSWERCWH
jgi:hypothetical protein